jgi:hypothetical protein
MADFYIWPNKPEVLPVRLALVGILILYPGDVSTCSAEGEKYTCLDVKIFTFSPQWNFYLFTPMKFFEYTPIPIKITPQEITDEYNLPPYYLMETFKFNELHLGR